jgi:SAM-dependent methyltransferase
MPLGPSIRKSPTWKSIWNSIPKSIQGWIRKPSRGRGWDDSLISDAWFQGHFEYAAQTTCEWLGSELELESAQLVDFGCGDGITALGVALHGRPRKLLGVDITQAFSRLETLARQQLRLDSLPRELEFLQVEAGKPLGATNLDGIYSWSVFEHVDRADLAPIASSFFDVLRPGGIAFIQIEPLYYSAFGSHLQRVVAEPWAHLRMDSGELEQSVMRFEGELAEEERDLASSEGVTPEFKEWLLREYRTLNRLTADELVQLFSNAGFEIIREQRGQRAEEPPAELCEKHHVDDLKTNEIRLLARKPN